jgi:hypothetical protein
VISTKQVGLVTLISVRLSPITSSPTISRPRAQRVGASASAISRSRSHQRARHALAAGRKVAARFAGLGDPRQAVGHGSPPDQQDALVAVADGRQVALRHDAAPRRIAVSVSTMTLRLGSSRVTRKMLLPPMPSSGFMTTSPSSSMKAWMSHRVARDQRGRREVGELGNGDFFRMVADRSRLVPDARTFGDRGALEQPGGGEVLEIEGRVLAHQDRIEGASAAGTLASTAIPVGMIIGEIQRCARACKHPSRQVSALALDRPARSWPRLCGGSASSPPRNPCRP